MVLELLLIWAIVITAVVAFVISERNDRKTRMSAAARHYATAPAYRHKTTASWPMTASRARPGGLTDVQRKFLEELSKQRG